MWDSDQPATPATDAAPPGGRVRVSICMPTYNHERYISQAVESVLMQSTNFAIELVIGEDCSTDRTRHILQDLAAAHPEKIRLRLARQNEGASRNFIQTFALCRGEFVVILEGDDYFTSPHKLQRQVAALDAHPEWSTCFHPARCLYEDGANGPELVPEQWDRAEASIEDLFEGNFMATSAVMFRNHLFGPFPEWFSDVIIGDWVIHILNAAHGKIGFLPEPMSVYRIHAGGIFSSKGLDFKLTTIFKMLAQLDRHLGGRYTEEIDEYRLRTVRWLVGQWENEQRAGQELGVRADQLTATIEQLKTSLAQLNLLEVGKHDPGAKHEGLNPRQVADYLGELSLKLSHAESESVRARKRTAELETECQDLHNELSELRQFYDLWGKAWLYRIYRETVRPWKRMRQAWLARAARRSQDPPKRKAA